MKKYAFYLLQVTDICAPTSWFDQSKVLCLQQICKLTKEKE